MEIAAADVGGTNARFAIAEVEDGRVVRLDAELTLPTSAYASFQRAWEAFGDHLGRPLPKRLAIAFAGPVGGEVLKLTNNPWVIRPALIPEKLGVDDYVVINDFGAVAHAVAQVDTDFLTHVCGVDEPLPRSGMISIVGPGTGLGVAAVLRTEHGYHAIETEGGHVDFAPLDHLEDRILQQLRQRHRRVSVERIVSGPGMVAVYEALAAIEGKAVIHGDDKALWASAIDGSDSLAAAALDRFFLTLGAVAGDIALAQGAKAVVIGGGLGYRLRDRIARSGFAQRFVAKGRFERRMAEMPVKLITHSQPGLFGAAAAFAMAHR
jgi:glucokinase